MAWIGRTRRALSAGLLGGIAAGTVCLLSVATPPTLRAATVPGAEAGAMIAGLALVAAWVVTLRLAATALAVGAAVLPGLAGRTARRLALAWSPRFCRSIVRGALGLSVVAGPLASGAAAFADQPALPQLDRIVATATVVDRVPPTVRSPAGPIAPRPTTRPVPVRAIGGTVVVRHGDTLWGIAARALPAGHSDADVARAWPRWYAANRSVIGPDPGQIRPGQRLVAPG